MGCGVRGGAVMKCDGLKKLCVIQLGQAFWQVDYNELLLKYANVVFLVYIWYSTTWICSLPGGGGSLQFRMGVCRWVPENMTLFQTKETQFCYPVPDKIMKIDTLFQTEKMWDAVDLLNIRNSTFEWTCSGTRAGTATTFVCTMILAAT